MKNDIKEAIISIMTKRTNKAEFYSSINELSEGLKKGGLNASRDRISSELGSLISEKKIGTMDQIFYHKAIQRRSSPNCGKEIL